MLNSNMAVTQNFLSCTYSITNWLIKFCMNFLTAKLSYEKITQIHQFVLSECWQLISLSPSSLHSNLEFRKLLSYLPCSLNHHFLSVFISLPVSVKLCFLYSFFSFLNSFHIFVLWGLFNIISILYMHIYIYIACAQGFFFLPPHTLL